MARHQVDDTGSQSGYNGNGKQKAGYCQQDIHKTHDHVVDGAAVETGRCSKASTQDQGNGHCHNAYA